MFLFDESDRARIDDFRDEVHDSDGLQVVTASGERVWRPLRNPTQLQVSSFTAEAPRGFGLVQRSRRVSRLSRPRGASTSSGRAPGSSRPATGARARWSWSRFRPTTRPTTTSSRSGARTTVIAGGQAVARSRIACAGTSTPQLTPALGTRHRDAHRPELRRQAPHLRRRVRRHRAATIEGLQHGRRAPRPASSRNLVLQPSPLTKGVRASFELDPSDADLAELRLRLMRADKPVSETWLYRWTAS